MVSLWLFLQGSKTYLVGWLSIAFAIVGLYLGQLDMDAVIQLINTSLLGMGIRHGISKSL